MLGWAIYIKLIAYAKVIPDCTKLNLDFKPLSALRICSYGIISANNTK